MDELTNHVLITLRAAFENTPLPDDPWKGRARLRRQEVAAWQTLQAALPETSLAQADICCLLACFGVEYAANLKRLLAAYSVWQFTPTRYAALPEGEGARPDLRSLPGHLARLYHRRQDQQTLECLLGLELPGIAAQTACQEALILLWDHHKAAILRAAAFSSMRISRIASALEMVCRMVREPLVDAAFEQHLLLARCNSDPNVMEAAGQILDCWRQQREQSLH